MRTDGVQLHRNGSYWLARWYDSDGRPRGRSLGRRDTLTEREALRLCRRIEAEQIVTPEARDARRTTLKAWTDAHLDADRPEQVQRMEAATVAYLLERFGERATLDSIGPAKARAWAAWLADKGLSPPTVASHVRRARALWRAAIAEGRASVDPWRAVAVAVAPPEHEDWADGRMIGPLLDACPSPAWRALYALVIYTRCRLSEALALRWEAVRFGEARIVIPNRKTRRKTGRAFRTVRMEPELERVLIECREATDGPMVVDLDPAKVRRDARKVYERAGIDCPGEPFKVWRRWRNAEWERQGYPRAVVRQWIGNSERVAQAHYDTVPAEYYGDRTPLAALREAQERIRMLEQAVDSRRPRE